MTDSLGEFQKNRDENRQFGRILIQNEHHLSHNNPNEAILLLNELISRRPPSNYVEMANNEIARIKRTFNV